MVELQIISLYRHNGAKALIQPYDSRRDSRMFQNCVNPHIQQANKTDRAGTCRLKFVSSAIWNDARTAGVTSRQILFDLIKAMQQNGMQLLCCADLNLTGLSAGTFFFQKNPAAPHETQIACLQLANMDKIRVIELPVHEIGPLEGILANSWKRGVQKHDKYGIPGFQLSGRPWCATETSNSDNIDAHMVMIKMLQYMESNGWSRVVAFDCSISSYDADSLLFFREPRVRQSPQPSEFCAIVLERAHKIRLIGAQEEVSLFTFENAALVHWKSGVKETNSFQNSRQIKCHGRPWCPNTTEENIASANFICGVLQDMWEIGWKWHCAIDMSVSVSDKSTFFLRRNLSDAESSNHGTIGCMQPKGSGKVNLVAFPAPILQLVAAEIQKRNWCVPLLQVAKHSATCATIHFQCTDLHRSWQTDQKIKTNSIYADLMTIIGGSSRDVTMLGSADISGNYTSGSEDSSASSLDTDVFFFLFS